MSCAHLPKPDPTKTEIYFINWMETEDELKEVIERCDKVNNP